MNFVQYINQFTLNFTVQEHNFNLVSSTNLCYNKGMKAYTDIKVETSKGTKYTNINYYDRYGLGIDWEDSDGTPSYSVFHVYKYFDKAKEELDNVLTLKVRFPSDIWS